MSACCRHMGLIGEGVWVIFLLCFKAILQDMESIFTGGACFSNPQVFSISPRPNDFATFFPIALCSLKVLRSGSCKRYETALLCSKAVSAVDVLDAHLSTPRLTGMNSWTYIRNSCWVELYALMDTQLLIPGQRNLRFTDALSSSDVVRRLARSPLLSHLRHIRSI